jgi:probable rRNA maturation factor
MAKLLLSRDVPLPKALLLPELRLRLRAMLKALALPNDTELSVLFTGDEHIQTLNRDYRHKNKPTDVLAFALREGEFADTEQPMLGDVVVSVDTAARQATAAKKPLLAEVTMLLAHGLLHLLGWDHETAVKDRAMRVETERLVLAAVGASRAKARKTPRTAVTTRNQTKKISGTKAPVARRRGKK